MKFEDALKAMREGKTVTSRKWHPPSIEIRIADGKLNFQLTPEEILREDWEIIPERFDFMEACRRMKDGKKVRRASWDDGAFMADGREAVRVHSKHLGIVNATFHLDAALATDWEEVTP